MKKLSIILVLTLFLVVSMNVNAQGLVPMRGVTHIDIEAEDFLTEGAYDEDEWVQRSVVDDEQAFGGKYVSIYPAGTSAMASYKETRNAIFYDGGNLSDTWGVYTVSVKCKSFAELKDSFYLAHATKDSLNVIDVHCTSTDYFKSQKVMFEGFPQIGFAPREGASIDSVSIDTQYSFVESSFSSDEETGVTECTFELNGDVRLFETSFDTPVMIVTHKNPTLGIVDIQTTSVSNRCSFTTENTDDYFEVMVWDGFSSATPICENRVFTIPV